MSWLRFALLVLMAWAGFAYQGPAQPLVRAVTIAAVAVYAAGSVLGARAPQSIAAGPWAGPGERPTHTELIVEVPGRPLLKNYGTLDTHILEKLDQRDSAPEGGLRIEALLAVTERWRFIFFGDPGTGDTIVWSATYKSMFCDKNLIYERMWQTVLEGSPEAEQEPYLVLGLSDDHEVYQMYLLAGFGAKPTVLSRFPVALLSPLKAEQHSEIAGRFGLRPVAQDTDVSVDAFGKHYIWYPEGEPYRIYEDDLFKFKVLHYWSGA